MAISIDLGSGAGSTNGDTLFEAFTKVNNMFSTTTKLNNGDLQINSVNIGKGVYGHVSNTAIGSLTLQSSDPSVGNTSLGYGALKLTEGNNNTAVGAYSMELNTQGFDNVAVGEASLYNNLSGEGNTAIGRASLNLNTTGNNNTAIGRQSMGLASTNTSTAVGVNSLESCSGDRNVGIGVNTLMSSAGADNTVVGSYAMQAATSGNNNVALGYAALGQSLSGNNNTAIGSNSLVINYPFSNSTGLGYNAQVEGSNQIQLGGGTTTCYTNGAVQNRSDLRDKTEVRNTVLGLDFINELRPVDYKWDMREDYRTEMPSQLDLDATEEEKEAYKILMDEWVESCKLENITHDGTHKRTRYHHGLIAQEVQDLIEASGVDFGGFQDHTVNGGGDVLSVGYTELIAPMIKAIQELTARINVLEGN